MKKKYDISSMCNALVDILYLARDSDLVNLNLKKGVMNLVDSQKQNQILKLFAKQEKTVELGGSSLNTIKALAQLGCRTVFAGMIGEDSLGTIVQREMNRYDIIECLTCHHSAQTGSCVVLVTPDGERTLNTHLGASSLYDSKIIPKNKITHSRFFHF